MEEFKKFTHHLNHQQKSIKIKFETNSSEVNFLDVVTYKGPNFSETGHLDYKVFFKPTDTHCLLHRESFHPSHTFRGILKITTSQISSYMLTRNRIQESSKDPF